MRTMTEHDPARGEDPNAHDPAAREELDAPRGAEAGAPTAGDAPADDARTTRGRGRERAPNMLPGRAARATGFERGVVRLIATGGVIGIGVGIAAILAANKVQGWIIGLVVATVSVVLAAVLWSSRQV